MRILILIAFSIFFSYTFHVSVVFFDEKLSNKSISSIINSILIIIYALFIFHITKASYFLRIILFTISTVLMSLSMLLHHSYIDLLKRYVCMLIIFTFLALIIPFL